MKYKWFSWERSGRDYSGEKILHPWHCKIFSAKFHQKGDVLGHQFSSLLEYSDEIIDKHLGIQVREIEMMLLERARKLRPGGNMESWGHSIHEGSQTWVGLAMETLQTPYAELRIVCDLLAPRPEEHIVDLGAGYGRLGLILDAFCPEVTFTGLELVKERVEEGERILKKQKCSRARLLQQDLSDPNFELPPADFYFIYDYGKVHHIRHTLKQLEQMVDQKKFKVVARGKGTRSLIEAHHPWLSQVHPPHHEQNFSIYSMSF